MFSKPLQELNSGEIKLLLLSKGVQVDEGVLEIIEKDKSIAENRYYYNISNEEEFCKKYKLPSEILLSDDVESSFYLDFESPLKIISENAAYKLLYKNIYLCDIDFNYKPNFFDKTLSLGVDCNKYASMYGRYILGLFLSGACMYVDKGDSCKFCSIGPSRKGIGSQNVIAISRAAMKEVVDVVSKLDGDRVKYVMYTAGTYPDVDKGIELQADLIKLMVDGLYDVNIEQHHLTTMPPKNVDLLKKLKEAGLDSIAYDIEVFDKNLFKYFCPGKDKYFGYDEMLKAVDDAIECFGKNNIKVGFVGGLEPIESMGKGMEYFAQRGASIAVNVFHPDPKTPVGNFQRPSVEYLIEMVKVQRDIYQKYDIVPVFPVGGRRSSLDTEIYRGFFNNL